MPELLALIRQSETVFEGQSLQLPHPGIFGGQLLAQSLYAATQALTDPGPVVALSATFLNFGDPSQPLTYAVRTLRDGRTAVRGVDVSQGDRLVLEALVTCQQDAPGWEYSNAYPGIASATDLLKSGDAHYDMGGDDFPFDLLRDPQEAGDATSSIWTRYHGEPMDGLLAQQMLLAFISDATILQSSVKPHGVNFGDPDLRMSTINHSMWFHRPFQAGQWLLLHSNCSSTGAGRALSGAEVYTEEGVLACTISQQAAMVRKTA